MAQQQEDKSSKTEEPTDKKLRDARKKGDVPSSKEPGALASTIALFVGLTFIVPTLAPALAGQLGNVVELAPTMVIGTGMPGMHDIGGILLAMLRPIFFIMLPLFATIVVAAIAGVLVQGETVASFERIKPKTSNISPASGFKRIFSAAALVDFAKNLVKVGVIAGVALFLTWGALSGVLPGAELLPETLPSYIRTNAAQLLVIVSIIFIPIAIADIFYKRYDWRKKQRMSMKEIRDEHKDMEGAPEIKQKRHQLRLERAQARMKERVPTANLVLTNPTHFAVALRYERGVDAAPVCVGKGADLMAARIREIAREHDIPIIENKALARALHDTVEVDDVVPAEHWEAVAQIVRWVIDLKSRIRRAPPTGSSLRLGD